MDARGTVDAQIAAMEARLADLRATQVAESVADAVVDGGSGGGELGADRRPVRALILDVLYDVNVPVYSREAAQLIRALYGRPVPPARFGVLSSDEDKSFRSSRARSVYLGHALTAERFEPIKRLWVRDDWPLEQRVVASTTGRTRHLMATIRLCEIADREAGRAAEPDILKYMAADHAADLPGVRVRRGHFDFLEWADIARDTVRDLIEEDTELRMAAAHRLAERSEYHQLFGMPGVVAFNDTRPSARHGGSGGGG